MTDRASRPEPYWRNKRTLDESAVVQTNGLIGNYLVRTQHRLLQTGLTKEAAEQLAECFNGGST